MSNKTFDLSSDQLVCAVPLPHRDLPMSLSPESHYNSSSLSLSPDLNSCNSNLSDRDTDGPPDMNMLEFCLSNGAAVDNPYGTTIPQTDAFCDGNLNQTFITTPLNGSVNFWNETLSVISSHERSLEKYQTFSKNSLDGSDSAVTSPDSAGRESQLVSCETSRRGSTENDCCSLSSGEMVIRSNSFCLEDQSSLTVSSLGGSSISQVAGCSSLPAESNLLSTILPDVCENSTQRVLKEDTNYSCLGKTFTQAESSTEENVILTSNSFIEMPDEKEGGIFVTFVCEKSPPDCEKETQFSRADAESPQFTPGPGKAFGSTLSAVRDVNKGIQTSTPVQSMGSRELDLSPFSESPCTGKAASPGLQPVKQKQIPGTPKRPLVSGLQLAGKVKKREIKTFPKLDFSKIKSKLVTRSVQQMSGTSKASVQQLSRVNKPAESHRGAAPRGSPARERSKTAAISASKLSSDPLRQVNLGAPDVEATEMQITRHFTVGGQSDSRASPPCHLLSAKTHAVAVKCSNACSKTEHAASSQLADTAPEHAGNKTFCLYLEKSPDTSDKPIPQPTPKKDISKKIEVKSSSALGQHNPPALKSRPRCSSESSSSASFLTKEQRTALRFSTSLTSTKADNHLGKTKPETPNSSQNKQAAQAGSTNRHAEYSKREVKMINLVVEPCKSTGVSLNDNKNRFRAWPSLGQTRGASSPRPASPSTRQRQRTLGRDECQTSKGVESAQVKQKSSTGSQMLQTTGGSLLGTASSASNKQQLNGCQTPQTPTRSSLMGPPLTPASRLPRKTLVPSKSFAEARVRTEPIEGAESTQVSGGAAAKQTPFKSTVLKARLITGPKKTTQSALATACKPATPTVKEAQNSTVSSLKRTSSARLRLTTSGPVDKSKPKTSSRPHQPQQQASRPNQNNGPPDVVPERVSKSGAKNQPIEKVRALLAEYDRRFGALAVVLQQTLSERDEATKHCRELSQELVNLRGELVSSVHSSERLEKEKDELRVALEDTLHKLQEQHQRDLDELEKKLQTFYQAEWDKVHLTYQEETDKCKALMQKQMGDLKAAHEAIQHELEDRHEEQLQCVKHQYETSLEEFRKVHNQDLQSLDKTLKDAEAAFTERLEVLTTENNALIEKLTAEENRRRELAEKCQKDSHTLYLEQELESLKVVLDIKTDQLHQQEKKLMEVDKLKEKNVKLDESLKRVQQENEELKARMDRHAALSRQLSSEQAVLQESLQKESKVNKRLSMENEELLWKLHNGDLNSPRKVSPNAASPSHSFSLQSPRSSGLFSSPPVSPR
ncbi:microtubule-associated tumor suppressor 1 homolog A isoform X1 [Xyrichtys novacula]|uniref:Microtubule-associated tumor suppressor 1 homolog A isoform X1 n=1 Tax=Xyrichtys novacula TaxID=13765 RepID=A0AAV1FBD6_XYRNO|nr:microtubule-associated tumor suppressor 1 homolog A isoform X1 [Xyrichtys novacula]